MRIFQTFSSASVKAGTQAAAVAVPGLGGIGEILAAIITLCDTVPQHRCVLAIPLAAKSLTNTFTETLLANSLADVGTSSKL